MEPQAVAAEEIGIRIYTASPRADPSAPHLPASSPARGPGSTIPPQAAASAPAGSGVGVKKKRAAVAKGVQTTLSKTSMLAHFLPTGTLLTFEMVLPSIYGTGQCTPVSTIMLVILLILCTLSCFFFHFTDSFRAPDGKTYFGFVTPKGLAVFRSGLDVEVPKDDKYRVQFSDFVHAMMSVLVFVAIAFSDQRVSHCLVPSHAKEMEEAMESFPLMVGIVCSCLFLVFPKARYGIGCMAT